jgi:trk system potassium uptake protein TrkH
MAVAVLAAIRGSNRLTVFRRQLPLAALQKALAITSTLAGLITVAVLILHFTEPGSPALDLLFEATSATGTVGLTTGLTPSLSAAGKLVITLCMFIGRLSPLTLAVALTGRMAANPDLLAYPDETIISG